MLLVTAAWSVAWGWVVVAVAGWLLPKLWWLVGLLLSLLVPRLALPPFLFLQPPPDDVLAVEVVVEVDRMDLAALESAWEADEPVLTEEALADAEALWEARQQAERRAELDREIAESAGILGALMATKEIDVLMISALSSDAFVGVGGVLGGEYGVVGSLDGDMYVSGGLGSRGSGLGGGGTAEGLGGLGTKGMGSIDTGSGKGSGAAAIPGPVLVDGDLDAAGVQEVVRRYGSQLSYCYQRELSKDPGLKGSMGVAFTITADGSVRDVGIVDASIDNDAVQTCVVGRYKRMTFASSGDASVVQQRLTFTPDG